MNVDISFPDGGDEEPSADRETIDAQVGRLRAAVSIDESGLPPFIVERTEGSVVLRPDEPLYVDELGDRFEVRAVGWNDDGTRTVTKVQFGENDHEMAEALS